MMGYKGGAWCDPVAVGPIGTGGRLGPIPQGSSRRCRSMPLGAGGRAGGTSTGSRSAMGRVAEQVSPSAVTISQGKVNGWHSSQRTWAPPLRWGTCTFKSPFHWALVSLLIALALLPTCRPEGSSAGPLSHGIVIDAGSSGTRMRIYEWRESIDCTQLPEFHERSNKKKTPGISAFVDNVDGLGDYMAELLDIAREKIPEEYQATTPLYVMATAGMRLLLEPNANAVMDKINSLMLDTTFNPFLYEDRNSRILSGEEEGSFAWLAVNYLRGVFSGDGVESAGILELGGASTQIAFLPDGAILADKWPMKIAKKSYALYVHSYLYYGQELTVRWAKQYLVRTGAANATQLINPCMLRGDNRTETILGREMTFIGTSDPDGCQKVVDVFVYKAADYNCHPKPCAISTVYQPTIKPTKQFYALSAFLFNLRDINALDSEGQFTPAGTISAARIYCSKSFSQVKEEIGGNEAFLSSNCLMGLYMPTLITKGYGFAEDTQQIMAVKKLKDTSLEWSLGAIIYEHQRKDRICHPRESAVCASSAVAVQDLVTLWVGLSILLSLQPWRHIQL